MPGVVGEGLGIMRTADDVQVVSIAKADKEEVEESDETADTPVEQTQE